MDDFMRAAKAIFECGVLHNQCASHLGRGDLASYFLDYHHVEQQLDAVNRGLEMLPAAQVMGLRVRHAELRKLVGELHQYVEENQHELSRQPIGLA